MFRTFNPELSRAEIQELASLVPDRKPQIPKAGEILGPMLDFLKARWLRNYFFTPDAIHVPHLASPSLSNALTCQTRSTCIDPVPLPPRSPVLPGESSDLIGNVMFMPIVTTQDQLTIGVGVLHASATCMPWSPKNGTSQLVQMNFRFARDARTRTLFQVYDAPESDCYLIVVARVESTTRTPKSAGVFRRGQLRELLLQEQDVHVGHLLPLVLELRHQVHHRRCVICGAPPYACCSCQLALPPPAHPFDSVYFRDGMAQHVCTTQAISSKVSFAGGVPTKHVVLGAQMSLSGVTDVNITHYLSKWSISNYLNSVTEDPLQSLLTLDNSIDSGKAESSKGNTQDQNAGMRSIDASGPGHALHGVDDVIDATAQGGFLQRTVVAEDASRIEQNNSPISHKMHSDPEISQGDPLIGGRSYNQPFNIPMSGHSVNEEVQWQQQSGDIVRRESQSQQPTRPIGNGMPPSTTSLGVVGTTKPKPTNNKTAETAAQDEAARLARIQKARERREKNRLAAHRSNLRNKEKREKLKVDLQNALDRAESLRAKEVALRKENLQLRKLFETQ